MKKTFVTLIAALMLAIAPATYSFAANAPTPQQQHLKKDGTPDKRYKENKHLTKSGKPDMRYKSNNSNAGKKKKS